MPAEGHGGDVMVDGVGDGAWSYEMLQPWENPWPWVNPERRHSCARNMRANELINNLL